MNEDNLMRGSDSYTKYENEVIHKYRDNLNHAESIEDVKKFFSYTMQELMNKVFDGQLDMRYEDVQLSVDNNPGFTISTDLRKKAAFEHVWEDSDLSSIVNRLAESALKRHKHLSGHPEKTNAKFNRH